MVEIHKKMTVEDVLRMKLVDLKNLCKTYMPNKYNVALNKNGIIEIITNNLININLKIKEIELFKNLIYEDKFTTNSMTMNSKEYYLYKGMECFFKENFTNEKSHSLRFDTIIFKTKDFSYKIIHINSKCGYDPIFEENMFGLRSGGRKRNYFCIKYGDDFGIKIDKIKGILYINTIINDYFFEMGDYGDEWLINLKGKRSHNYEEIEAFVYNKDSFQVIKDFPRGYSSE